MSNGDQRYYPKQKMSDALWRGYHSDDAARNRVRYGDHPIRSYIDSRYRTISDPASREYLLRKHRRGKRRSSRR